MPELDGVVAIVDDDASMLRALQRSLALAGYRVKVFASAERYLAEVDAAEVACAVLDIQLGSGASGLELGRRISSMHATPIVFMTGSRDPALHSRAEEIGCISFLVKPFSAVSLIDALMTLPGQGC